MRALSLVFVLACAPLTDSETLALAEETIVATTYPPDGWAMTSGAWGTDADHATDQSYAGASAVKFPSAGSNSARMRSELIAVGGNASIIPDFWLRADSVAAGVQTYVAVERYDKASSLLGTTTVLDTTHGANLWRRIRGIIAANNNTSAVRLIVGKNATTSYNLWFGKYAIKHGVPKFRASRSVVQSISDATVTKVEFDSEEYDHSDCYDPATNYRWRLNDAEVGHSQQEAWWHFDTTVRVENQGTNAVAIYIAKNGAPGGGGTVLAYNKIDTPGAAAHIALNVSCDAKLAGNDTVAVYVYQNAGGARDTGTAGDCFFSGHEIEP